MSIKQYGKNENKRKYNEKYICCFFAIWNLESAITYKCVQIVVFRALVYFSIRKLTLSFSTFLSTILSNVYFYMVSAIFPFLFNRSQSKAGVVNQMSHLCFRRRSTIQLNVQTATAEKEKLYALSNMKSNAET